MAERFVFMPLLGIIIAIVTWCLDAAGMLSAKKMNTASIVLLCLTSLIFFGQSIIRNKDWESNETLYASAVVNAPNSSRVHYNYGTVLLNESLAGTANEMPAALDQLTIAKEININNYGQYFNLGVANYHSGKYSEAVAILSKAVSNLPADTVQWINLADAFLKIKAYDSAIVYYKKAYNTEAWSPGSYNKYASSLFSLQKYKDAELVFEKGLTVDSANAEMWMNYGNTMAVQQKYQPAIAAFEKTLSIDPSRKQALYFLAITWKSLGNNAKAEAYYKQFQLSK